MFCCFSSLEPFVFFGGNFGTKPLATIIGEPAALHTIAEVSTAHPGGIKVALGPFWCVGKQLGTDTSKI